MPRVRYGAPFAHGEHASKVACPVCKSEAVSWVVQTIESIQRSRPLGANERAGCELRSKPKGNARRLLECRACGHTWRMPWWLNPGEPLHPVVPCPPPEERPFEVGEEVWTPEGKHAGHALRIIAAARDHGLLAVECLDCETRGRRPRFEINMRSARRPEDDPAAIAMRNAAETMPEGARVVVRKGERRGACGVVKEHGVSTIAVRIDGDRADTRFFPNELRPEGGFKFAAEEHGRLSCSEPNLQQVPREAMTDCRLFGSGEAEEALKQPNPLFVGERPPLKAGDRVQIAHEAHGHYGHTGTVAWVRAGDGCVQVSCDCGEVYYNHDPEFVLLLPEEQKAAQEEAKRRHGGE